MSSAIIPARRTENTDTMYLLKKFCDKYSVSLKNWETSDIYCHIWSHSQFHMHKSIYKIYFPTFLF